MKLRSPWFQYHRVYANVSSWSSLWLHSNSTWLAFQYPKNVRKLVNTLPTKRNVRKSGFATLVLYNLPQQSEPCAVAVVATSTSQASLSSTHLSSPVALDLWKKSKVKGNVVVRPLSLLSAFRSMPNNSTLTGSLLQPFRSFHSSRSISKNTSNSKNPKSHLPESRDDSNTIYRPNSNQLNSHEIDHESHISPSLHQPPHQPGHKSDHHHPHHHLNNNNTNSHIRNYNDKRTAITPDPVETHLATLRDARNSLQEYREPTLPQKPKPTTKQDLLANTQGIYGRLWVHLRWAMFKQVRPLTTDDIGALFSWILVGNIIWILLGTTTFFSLVLFTMNTVFAQEYIAEKVGNFITRNTGLTVVFENAIVPHWSDGMISFNKVFVSRRPNRGNHRVQKGSQAAAAADAAALEDSVLPNDVEDRNYTQFDLTIDTVSVTLSVSKWVNGGGIVQDVEVKGLRGIVDRRHVKWDPNDDPVSYKNVHTPGDFEIENFKMEDALVTLYHPNEFRPFRVSIFNCELPRLRKHWLFYDILSANNMSGTYDNSLFTIHPRQLEEVSNYDKSTWKTINRLRIDGVNIDHLNTGMEGPFGWIESGNVDLCADIMFPVEESNINFSQVLRDIKSSLGRNWASGQGDYSEAESERSNFVFQDGEWKRKVIHAESKTLLSFNKDPSTLTANKYIVMDLRVQINNSRAAVPIFTSDLTYINNALIRPIVAYINSRDTYIPIKCRIIKKYDDFEGSWTMYDSKLMDDISAAVYDAFAANIMDDEARAMRMKKVGFWSLQLALQLLLVSLGALA